MKETSNQPQNQNCFNTALLLPVPKNESPSLSPRSNNPMDNSSSLHNYLPFELINRIETISPAQRDQSPTSQRMSDIELKSNEDNKSSSSYNEDNDDIVLRRDITLPVWMPQNTMMTYANTVNTNVGSNIMKPKKKSKKKKKKDEFTIEMFGRRGWICEQCNNFNYDSRHKCNRCGIPKQPKLINSTLNLVNFNNTNENDNHKGDWCCKNCNNLNYAFRLVCNRCQMPKGDSSKVSPSS